MESGKAGDDALSIEFYEAIADLFANAFNVMKLLDLGCGMGLELERLYLRYPNK